MLATIDNAKYYNETYGPFGMTYQLPANQLYHDDQQM